MIMLSLILRRFLFIIVMLVLLIGMLYFADVSFKSERARQILLENIKSYTGRNVTIDGDAYLTVSLSPKILVEQIHISNINGFGTEDFITINEARVEVSLLPLLSGTFHLEEIAADQTKISLIEKKDGSYNWSFDHVTETKEIKTEDQKDGLEKQRIIKQISLGTFNLTDVSILYEDESRNQIIKKHFERLLIDVTNPAKPNAEVSGSVQELPYSIDFESDPIQSFVSGQTWLLHGTGKIAGSKINVEANLQLIERAIIGNIHTNATNINLGLLLEKLGIIDGQDAIAEEIDISTKFHGSDYTELYERAETNVQLSRGHWKLSSSEAKLEKEFSFDKVTSFISWNKPVELKLDGKVDGESINIDFKTNRLLEFFDEAHKLDVDLKSKFAGTDTTLKGTLDLPIKIQQFRLDLSLKAKDLEKLNPILNAELPPFNNFSLTGKLIANKKGFILKSTKASIGDSHFQTSIVIDTVSAIPLWVININSRQLQLNDFAFDILDLQQPDNSTAKTIKQNIDDLIELRPIYRLMKIMQTEKIHFNLNLKVDKLLSGGTTLGKARFQLNLRDNAASLNNVDIEIPGGNIKASASFEIIEDNVTGDIELNIDKLDYGITARMFNPEATLDGVISANVDLEIAGNNIMQLLDHATGQLDIAVWPKNTQAAKILDLWATNLYLILLPELKKKESKVNCLVGLMNLEDGKMKEDFFAIDTTKLWIQGNFNVDFAQQNIQLSLFPRSKTARLFSLQSPIRASGSFTDISLNVNVLDLGVTYISFITSPLHVPTRWVFGGKPPKDGSAICEQFFDREYVENLNKELKRKRQEEIDEILDSDY
jgi:uncharacterized protein involved in outer membrane biogenesis